MLQQIIIFPDKYDFITLNCSLGAKYLLFIIGNKLWEIR